MTRSSPNTQQKALIERLDYVSFLQFLFDLAVTFESLYVHVPDRVQSGTFALNRLILDVLRHKSFSRLDPKLSEAEQQVILLHSLYKAVSEKDYARLRLINRLISSYINQERAEDLRREREVFKHNLLIQFYYNLADTKIAALTEHGRFTPLGKTEVDKEASTVQAIQKEAAKEFLAVYGIEASFNYEGKEYTLALLLDLFALLISYCQSRYGMLFEEQVKTQPVPQAVLQTAVQYLNQGGHEIPGPLLLTSWQDLVDRSLRVFSQRAQRKEVEAHLNLFATKLTPKRTELDLFSTPLLKIEQYVAVFVRPLMLQNPFMHLAYRLVSNKNNADEAARVNRSSERLGKLFTENGFTTLVEEKLYRDNGSLLTDIDVGAFKDNYLFLIQLKTTTPKPTYIEMKSHLEGALKKAGKQNRKVVDYLQTNWPAFRARFGTKAAREEITMLPLVVSSLFEKDRHSFSGSMKISLFELERYLLDDAYFLFHNSIDPPPRSPQPPLFHKAGELSAAKLYQLIRDDGLWSSVFSPE